MAAGPSNTRLSLRELDDYPERKNNFLKAWKMIQELPPSNPNSFWAIASYHGLPFKDRRVTPFLRAGTTDEWWDGYCQHGNVLFPTWHRFYCLKLEQALQTVLPDGDVNLHYWDSTSAQSLANGLPDIVLAENVTIDGRSEPNPLRNFRLPRALGDNNIEHNQNSQYYLKPKGYTTHRYPFSGIISPVEAAEYSTKHNLKIKAMSKPSETLLQENVSQWLKIGRYPPREGEASNSVLSEFRACLDTPDFNIFSNTTSASDSGNVFQSIEQPHNDIHLAIGGYTMPQTNDDGTIERDESGNIVYDYVGLVEGANGDMGANETASYDPIFFLHHANIDRMFWVWQKKHGHTSDLTIRKERPNQGTSTKGQGPTPNQSPDTKLDMDTILYPYQNELGVPRTSNDCINVEDLGYNYSIGSLDQDVWPTLFYERETFSEKVHSWNEVEAKLTEAVSVRRMAKIPVSASFDLTQIPDGGPVPIFANAAPGEINFAGKKWRTRNYIGVRNIDRSTIQGSFVVQVFYEKDGKLYFIGQRGVLDRWERESCANCRDHREAAVGFDVGDVVNAASDIGKLLILLVSKDPATGQRISINVQDSGKMGNFTYKAGDPTVRFIKRFDEDLGE